MAELDLQQELRASIARSMIDSPSDTAKLRLRTLLSVLPVEIKGWLEGVAIYLDYQEEQEYPPIIHSVIAFDHGSRRSMFLESENLVWLEALTFRTYQYTGIAHVLIRDGQQTKVSSYCPTTHKYTLWSA